MGIFIKMIYSTCIKGRRTALYSMYDVALIQEKFGEVGAILPGYTCDEGCLFHLS